MGDASEDGIGLLDPLSQLPRPTETPGHSGHVLMHRGEPWGHGTGGMSEALAPSPTREHLPPGALPSRANVTLKRGGGSQEMGM